MHRSAIDTAARAAATAPAHVAACISAFANNVAVATTTICLFKPNHIPTSSTVVDSKIALKAPIKREPGSVITKSSTRQFGASGLVDSELKVQGFSIWDLVSGYRDV